MDCSQPGSSVHGDSPGKNTEVGCHVLLQGNFPTQGLNPGLLHFKKILCYLNHQGSPQILEWVAYPFSRGSSPPRNRTGVSCMAGGFFTNWAIRDAQACLESVKSEGRQGGVGNEGWEVEPRWRERGNGRKCCIWERSPEVGWSQLGHEQTQETWLSNFVSLFVSILLSLPRSLLSRL